MYRGQLNDARNIFEEVVSDMTRILGPDHEDNLTARSNLGNVLSKYFTFREALELHLDVLKRMTSIFGKTDLKVLVAKENVATAYLNIGGDENLEKGLDLIEEVIHERSRKLGKENPYTLLAMVYQARIKDAMG